MNNKLEIRAQLYHLLAEVLAEPPLWLVEAGRNWPLFEVALALSEIENEPELREAVVQMAAVPAETMNSRRSRYNELLDGNSQPLAIYESLAREGRLSGAITLKVAALYKAVGLIPGGFELPDHVSVELDFLSFLLEQENQSEEAVQWHKARKLFVNNHVAQWMLTLAREIILSGDLVYVPIARLMLAALNSELRPHRARNVGAERVLPIVSNLSACNLCGFCVQVCPTKTLAVYETYDNTSLLLNDASCVSCNKCVRICPTKTMQLQSAEVQKTPRTLFQSERAHCPGCNKPTISRAELDEVASQIGSPKWLEYCLECRTIMY